MKGTNLKFERRSPNIASLTCEAWCLRKAAAGFGAYGKAQLRQTRGGGRKLFKGMYTRTGGGFGRHGVQLPLLQRADPAYVVSILSLIVTEQRKTWNWRQYLWKACSHIR